MQNQVVGWSLTPPLYLVLKTICFSRLCVPLQVPRHNHLLSIWLARPSVEPIDHHDVQPLFKHNNPQARYSETRTLQISLDLQETETNNCQDGSTIVLVHFIKSSGPNLLKPQPEAHSPKVALRPPSVSFSAERRAWTKGNLKHD